MVRKKPFHNTFLAAPHSLFYFRNRIFPTAQQRSILFPFRTLLSPPALYETAKCKENTRRNSFVKTRSVLAVDFFLSGLSVFVPRRVTRLRIYLRRSSKWGRKDRLNRYLVYTYYCGEGGSLIDRVCATAEEADIGKGGGGGVAIYCTARWLLARISLLCPCLYARP